MDESLAAGRYQVSMIVGRDTAEMTEADVVRATVETVAENTSDGVVAPILSAVAGGAPVALAYKAVSTLDSMVGYKNERYRHFGWASARLDDLLNLVPARLTAVLATVAGGPGPGRRAPLVGGPHACTRAPTPVWSRRRSPRRCRCGSAGRRATATAWSSASTWAREFAPAERADIERVIALSARVGELALAVGLAARWTCWVWRTARGGRRP